jgi:hypothetical protein
MAHIQLSHDSYAGTMVYVYAMITLQMLGLIMKLMFRSIRLPVGTRGALRLHSMPGRRETLEKAWKQVQMAGEPQ